MKTAQFVHLLTIMIGIVLTVVLPHEIHMTFAVALVVVVFGAAACWMVFGTLWWLIRVLLRKS